MNIPEGPSIIILREAVQLFKGKKIIAVGGNTTKIDLTLLRSKKIVDFKSWGKHFLICFENCTVRIHFLLFGYYKITETKEATPRLHLQFSKGEFNFYACSVQLLTDDLDSVYDWSGDVMNERWDQKKARAKLLKIPETLVCDALLNQDTFAGVGNIIKNEVCYRIKVHPATMVGNLPPKKLKELLNEAVTYSFDFLKWKKEFTLKAHWLAHTKKICMQFNEPIKKAYLGKTKRCTFFCEHCQVFV